MSVSPIISMGVNVFNADGISFFSKRMNIGIKRFDVVHFGSVDASMRFLIAASLEKHFQEFFKNPLSKISSITCEDSITLSS